MVQLNADLVDKGEAYKIEAGDNLRLYQGDVICGVSFVENFNIGNADEFELRLIEFPHIIVLSQDCDLDEDFKNRSMKESPNQDKLLFSIIVAPLYKADQFRAGIHLIGTGIDQKMEAKNSVMWNRIIRNNDSRYHYLRFIPNPPLLVPSVVDFKHYFSVSAEYLTRKKCDGYIGKVSELYREKVSQRFAVYLSRIGLPDEPNKP